MDMTAMILVGLSLGKCFSKSEFSGHCKNLKLCIIVLTDLTIGLLLGWGQKAEQGDSKSEILL